MRCHLTYILAAAGLVVITACSSSSDTDTTVAPGPASAEEAVEQWLDALAAGDPGATSSLVEEPGLVLALAAENRLSVPEVAALQESGIPDAALDPYWSSFADSLDVFADGGVDSLTARSDDPIDGHPGFAAVAVAEPTAVRSTVIVAHRGEDGAWRVDLLATVGPGLVQPLTDLHDAAVSSDAEVSILPLLKAAQPSLEAGLEAQGDDFPAEFRTETLSLIADLAVIPPEASS
jgi:hypothetical protein